MSKRAHYEQEEKFPVMSTVIQYIRADEVLGLAPLDGQTVAETLAKKVRLTASKTGVDPWGNAQVSITMSDKPQYAYKVKLAALTWVDEETKRQMEEEATIQSRYTTIEHGYGWGEQWDAHLTFPATNQRDKIVVDMDAGAGGILFDFTNYGTLMADEGGGLVLITMDGPHPKVYTWSDVMQEDPTHVVSLEKAYVGVRPIVPEEVRDESIDEGEDCDCLTGRGSATE